MWQRLQESVVWALLAAPKGTLNGKAIAQLFEAAINEELKCAIAAVIHETRPPNIEEWLITAVSDSRSRASRSLLASAMAKMAPSDQAIPVLMAIFDDAPLAAVHPLGKVGAEDERMFLASKLPTATGPLRREIRQAIARIERRLAKTHPNGRGQRVHHSNSESL